MPELHPGRKALAHTSKVLEQRPFKDDDELSLATQCLSRFRAELIDKQRHHSATATDRERLARLNAIVALVMGMHFPIGDAPWDEFEKVQSWLEELTEEVEPKS